MGINYTNGWDVVTATNFGTVNKALTYAYDQSVIPHAGKGQFPVTLGGVQTTGSIDAEMGSWQMTGGSGQNVIVLVPFTNGVAHIGNKNINLKGVHLFVTVLLRFVQSSLAGGKTEYKLTINLTDPAAIVATRLENIPPNLSAEEKTALEIIINNLLKQTLAGKQVEVAKLDTSEIPSEFSWMIPKEMKYAATSNAYGVGDIGILLATLNSAPPTPPTLLKGTIPNGCDSALIISNQIFSEKLFAPSFASALGVPDNRIIHSGNEPETLALSGSASVSGSTITSASAYADDGLIHMTMNGHASPMSGVKVNFTINATYKLVLGGSPSNPALEFQRTSQHESHSTDIAWWVYVVSGLSGGAIGIIVVECIQAIVNHSAGPKIDCALPTGFSKSFEWPFSEAVTLKQALLPCPLQLGGVVS